MIKEYNSKLGKVVFGNTVEDLMSIIEQYDITDTLDSVSKLETHFKAWKNLNYNPCKKEIPNIRNIYYNGNSTTVKWTDGTVTTVTATDDEQGATHELGVAMAIVRKLFPNRQEFLRIVESGIDQTKKSKK